MGTRQLNRLSAKTAASRREPGLYCDGGGLYLQITRSGSKTWIFRYRSPLTRKLRDMGLTVHGFRSSFRDWAAERTAFTHEVCEMALAHTIPNAAEAAYRRGDLFQKRAGLMKAWAEFLAAPPQAGEVIPLRSAA
jgi:integrase